MILTALLMAVLSFPVPQGGPAPAFAISHQAVDCVVAGKFPRLEARFPENAAVASAKVYFQGASQEWYAVTMKAEGVVFAGILPSPKKDLKQFHYYIEATSRTMETARTEDRSARVVAAPGECRGVLSAVAVSAAKIVVQGPAGAAVAPSGFANAGLAAAGGGISGTTVAVGAAVVGGGALAATQLAGGEGGDGSEEYAGPVSGELTILFGPCTRQERYSFTLTIELTDATSGVAGSQPGKYEVLSATNCATGPQTGLTTPFGIGQAPVTRSGSAISFSYLESNGQGSTQVDFKGTLQGETISGTLTLVSRVPNLTGISVSTPMVAPVTLTRLK